MTEAVFDNKGQILKGMETAMMPQIRIIRHLLDVWGGFCGLPKITNQLKPLFQQWSRRDRQCQLPSRANKL
jgi:hypothetical protein